MDRRVAGACLVIVVAAGCNGAADPSVSAPTARELARRLADAHLCTGVGRPPVAYREQQAMLGMSDVWQCGMAKPTDGGSGAPVVAIWAGRSAREQRRVLRQVNDLYDTACEGPDGSAASGSSDGTTSTRSARPAVTLRYITGGRWIAFVDINARIEPIANVLDGQVEVKRCGADSLKGS